MHGQVDENINPVRADEAGKVFIREGGRLAPAIGMRRGKPLRDRVRPRGARVADDLEELVVVRFQKRQQEPADRMLAQVRRNITDAQAPLRRGLVVVGPNRLGQGLGIPPAPASVLFQ